MIPQVIHRIWIGGPEPAWLARYADTWRDLHPDWDYHYWTDETVEALFPLDNQALYDRAERIVPRHVWQFRSDLLRYEILWRWGGMYVDADFECLHPLDDLIDGLDGWAVWSSQDRWIANGLLGVTPSHPFIGRLIDRLPARVRQQGRNSRPARISGPQYLTKLWRAHGRPLTILPERLFFPYSWRDVAEVSPGAAHGEGLYAVHHWHNMRRERGLL